MELSFKLLGYMECLLEIEIGYSFVFLEEVMREMLLLRIIQSRGNRQNRKARSRFSGFSGFFIPIVIIKIILRW